jgi:FixJ family two-component response regulator
VLESPPFIAVIDDDESMCQALSRLLSVAGYDVRSYFSAESFLDDPEHARTRFVVADIQLRGMSGLDLQRKLRQDNPALPFAFITAHDEPATRSQATAAGHAAYLRKPFPGCALLDIIKNQCGTEARGTIFSGHFGGQEKSKETKTESKKNNQGKV